jgi:hypothetical protein
LGASRARVATLYEAAKTGKTAADLFLSMVEDIAQIVTEKLLLHRGARFREDSAKMTQAIHQGFGLALALIEPDKADWFLKRSAVLMEDIFKSTRKGRRESINPKKDRSEES